MPVALELPSAKTYTAPLEYVAPYQDDHRHPVVNNDTEVSQYSSIGRLPSKKVPPRSLSIVYSTARIPSIILLYTGPRTEVFYPHNN